MPKEPDVLIELGKIIQKKAAVWLKPNVGWSNVANIDERTIRRILAGKQNASIKVLKRVCEALVLQFLNF